MWQWKIQAPGMVSEGEGDGKKRGMGVKESGVVTGMDGMDGMGGVRGMRDVPGLSALNAMMAKPPAGSITTSRRAGLLQLMYLF